MKITRQHIGKNWEVLGEYEITNSEREIFYNGAPVDGHQLSADDSNRLEKLKDGFEDGFNLLEEIDGCLYEIIRDSKFEIRRKVENYKEA